MGDQPSRWVRREPTRRQPATVPWTMSLCSALFRSKATLGMRLSCPYSADYDARMKRRRNTNRPLMQSVHPMSGLACAKLAAVPRLPDTPDRLRPATGTIWLRRPVGSYVRPKAREPALAHAFPEKDFVIPGPLAAGHLVGDLYAVAVEVVDVDPYGDTVVRHSLYRNVLFLSLL